MATEPYKEIEIVLGRERLRTKDKEFSMRNLVLAAVRETNPDCENPLPESEQEDPDLEPPSLPTPESDDVDAWDDLLEELMDRVLWGDRDFEEEEIFLDKDPRESQQMKRFMGIDGDYFSAIAPEPTDQQLTMIRKTLRQLCDRE